MKLLETVFTLMYPLKRTFGIFAPFFELTAIKLIEDHARSNGRPKREV